MKKKQEFNQGLWSKYEISKFCPAITTRPSSFIFGQKKSLCSYLCHLGSPWSKRGLRHHRPWHTFRPPLCSLWCLWTRSHLVYLVPRQKAAVGQRQWRIVISHPTHLRCSARFGAMPYTLHPVQLPDAQNSCIFWDLWPLLRRRFPRIRFFHPISVCSWPTSSFRQPCSVSRWTREMAGCQPPKTELGQNGCSPSLFKRQCSEETHCAYSSRGRWRQHHSLSCGPQSWGTTWLSPNNGATDQCIIQIVLLPPQTNSENKEIPLSPCSDTARACYCFVPYWLRQRSTGWASRNSPGEVATYPKLSSSSHHGCKPAWIHHSNSLLPSLAPSLSAHRVWDCCPSVPLPSWSRATIPQCTKQPSRRRPWIPLLLPASTLLPSQPHEKLWRPSFLSRLSLNLEFLTPRPSLTSSFSLLSSFSLTLFRCKLKTFLFWTALSFPMFIVGADSVFG